MQNANPATLRQPGIHLAQRIRVMQQRRDVPEQNPRLRKVRHVPDQALPPRYRSHINHARMLLAASGAVNGTVALPYPEGTMPL